MTPKPLHWCCLYAVMGWTLHVCHLFLQNQFRKDWVQDKKLIVQWTYLTKWLCFFLCFLPSKTLFYPIVTSLQAKAQPALFLVWNLLSAFSHLPLIFDFSLPSACLFSIASSYFSLFSVSIPAAFPTNSSWFLQYHVFIIPCNHLILFFILWFAIQCLSLSDCLWWIQHGFDSFGGWCPIWK